MQVDKHVDYHECVHVICNLSPPVMIMELFVIVSALINAILAEHFRVWLTLSTKADTFVECNHLATFVTDRFSAITILFRGTKFLKLFISQENGILDNFPIDFDLNTLQLLQEFSFFH